MAVYVLEHLTTSAWGFHNLPAVAMNPPCDWKEEVMRGLVHYVSTHRRHEMHAFSVNNPTTSPGSCVIILVCHSLRPPVKSIELTPQQKTEESLLQSIRGFSSVVNTIFSDRK